MAKNAKAARVQLGISIVELVEQGDRKTILELTCNFNRDDAPSFMRNALDEVRSAVELKLKELLS